MTDAIAQLCQIIIEKLQEQPEATQADLAVQVEAAIVENLDLVAALQANSEMLQNNRGEATGIQNLVKGGTVYNGDHYDFHIHLTGLNGSDREKCQAALTEVLEKLPTIRQPVALPQNLPHSGIEPEKFVGREDDLQWLDDRCQRNDRVVISAVSVIGGFGET